MAIKFKPPFSVIVCCYLLASVLFFPHGIDSRILLGVQEDGKGQSKAAVKGSPTHTAPSWAGQNSPPASAGVVIKSLTPERTVRKSCGRMSYTECVAGSSSQNRNLYSSRGCTTYKRNCHRNL